MTLRTYVSDRWHSISKHFSKLLGWQFYPHETPIETPDVPRESEYESVSTIAGKPVIVESEAVLIHGREARQLAETAILDRIRDEGGDPDPTKISIVADADEKDWFLRGFTPKDSWAVRIVDYSDLTEELIEAVLLVPEDLVRLDDDGSLCRVELYKKVKPIVVRPV